jgi:acyl-coenzyme A synthetase/AMP-(fatty) acid ligase
VAPAGELMRRMVDNSAHPAIVYDGDTFLYSDLLQMKTAADDFLHSFSVVPGEVVALCADYSPASLAMLLALIDNRNIAVPISIGMDTGGGQYLEIADPDYLIEIESEKYSLEKRQRLSPRNELILELVTQSAPGLILFTSGTTGTPKAVLHNVDKLLSKFLDADKRHTTLCFLMFDHIGGVDTYFYSLFSGGLAVFPGSRDPAHICDLIETHRVEVMPVSPTFLNLLLMSGAHRLSDLSSLQIITFGAEKISDSLLARVEQEFSPVRLIQKYGITELGSPSSKTHPEDSSLIKVGGERVDVKVIDGILHIKADTAMVGYLNAESPFTEEGWYNTGDAAEEHGEYIKILGRTSDMINVGGEKVFPAEVESVILELDTIADVIVYGEENLRIGQMVCARVQLAPWVDDEDIAQQVKRHCGRRLEKHKVPAKVTISEERLHTDRFKKISGMAN